MLGKTRNYIDGRITKFLSKRPWKWSGKGNKPAKHRAIIPPTHQCYTWWSKQRFSFSECSVLDSSCLMPSALYVSRSSSATDMICCQNLPDVICFCFSLEPISFKGPDSLNMPNSCVSFVLFERLTGGLCKSSGTCTGSCGQRTGIQEYEWSDSVPVLAYVWFI